MFVATVFGPQPLVPTAVTAAPHSRPTVTSVRPTAELVTVLPLDSVR